MSLISHSLQEYVLPREPSPGMLSQKHQAYDILWALKSYSNAYSYHLERFPTDGVQRNLAAIGRRPCVRQSAPRLSKLPR